MNLIDIPLGEVIYGRMVLGALVSKVFVSLCSEVAKLALWVSALQPVKLHFRGLCFAGGDRFIGQSNGSRVVALDCWSRLGPSLFHKCLADWAHFFGADLEICEFRFRGRGYDALVYLCNCDHRSIVMWDKGVLRKYDLCACAAACLSKVEVGCVRVAQKDHGAGSEVDAVI